MEIIIQNWAIIFVSFLAGIVAVTVIKDFFTNKTPDEQIAKVKEWLLYAVAQAEKELGGGTGQLKLRYVYDLFLVKFSFLAQIISFETFSVMVDEVLIIFKKMISENQNVKIYVDKKGE